MINRRVTRSSRAVERLQQLSLNSSAGVDCNRPHNDIKSVYAMKNMTVNADGSLSLRKPIILNNRFSNTIVKVVPLPNDCYIAISDVGFLILNDTLKSIPFRIIWRDVFDNERINEVPTDTYIPQASLNIKECSVANTASGVLLGNCKLYRTVSTFPGVSKDTVGEYLPIFDEGLYDSTSGTDYSLRMVNVKYNADQLLWCVYVNVPYPNEYADTDSGTRVLHNALLDNPFAARDVYGVAVPSVKDIRPYVYSAESPEGVSVADKMSEVRFFKKYPFNEFVRTIPFNLESDKTEHSGNSISNPTFIRTLKFSAAYSSTCYILKIGNVAYQIDLNISGAFTVSVEHAAGENWGKVLDKSSENTLEVSATHKIARKNAPEGSEDVTVLKGFQIQIPNHSIVFSATHNSELLETGPIQLGSASHTYNGKALTVSADTFSVKDSVILALQSYNLAKALSLENDMVQKLFNNVASNTQPTSIEFKVLVPKSEPTLSYLGEMSDAPVDIRVSDLTESVKPVRYRAATYVNFSKCNNVILKAFVNFPTPQFDPLYCSWQYTLDGVTWTDALASRDDGVVVEEKSQAPVEDVTVSEESAPTATYRYVPLLSDGVYSFENDIQKRGDCLILTKRSDEVSDTWDAVAFKFKLVTLDTNAKKVKATYGEKLFYKAVGADTEFEEFDLGNAAAGSLLYNKTRLYSYGNSALKNNIFFSYPNELELPTTNVITLSASSDREVTTLVRWRDYLVSATEHALYLSEVQDGLAYTKTLNTAVGIPKEDCRCCVPVLNGVLFKSGTKVYQLYPNVYSDDGTTLNVTDVSQPVSHYLEDYAYASNGAFAFSTESEYVLMLPNAYCTRCLRYNYNTRVWTYHEYDANITDVRINALDDIRLYGTLYGKSNVCEFKFDTEISTVLAKRVSAEELETIPYGDVLSRISNDTPYGSGLEDTVLELLQYLQSAQDSCCISPISFEVDTGQKTDTILTTKQFVESKLVFATLNKNDAFPMQLAVHVDGDPHLVTRDISTDAPFWKDGSTSGVLNTTFGGLSSTSDNFNTLRQLVVRYSGKGKSVRHILTGESLCNFKLYETYIRYKLLNVKQ